jgi:hypothetical protein
MPLYPPTPNTPQSGLHDCRFEYMDANTCKLLPYGGNQLMIGGVRRTIPAGGVTLTTPGAAWASLVMYIWAFVDAGGAIVLGTTGVAPGYVVLDAYGMPVYKDNAALTLVGIVACASGTGLFQQTIGVVSYWNRKQRAAYQRIAGLSTASTTPVDLSAAVGWCSFDGDCPRVTCSGTVRNSVIGTAAHLLKLDGTTYIGQQGTWTSFIATTPGQIASQGEQANIAAGQHWVSLFGWVGSGTGTWDAIIGIMVDY